jgi:hypothetical protein
MSWFAARHIASPTASGEKPSASAAAAASAAVSGVPLKISWLSFSMKSSSALRSPGVRSSSLYFSIIAGITAARRRILLRHGLRV